MTLPAVKDEYLHRAYSVLDIEGMSCRCKENGKNNNTRYRTEAMNDEDEVQGAARGAQFCMTQWQADGNIALQGHRCQSDRRYKCIHRHNNIYNNTQPHLYGEPEIGENE